jgi:anti-anti-sigma factor
MATDYEFACEARADRLIVRGDCDLASSRRLSEAIAAFDGRPVEIDLSAVTFFDSTALRVLLSARGRNPALRVGPMSQDVAVVLKISGSYKALRRLAGELESTAAAATAPAATASSS